MNKLNLLLQGFKVLHVSSVCINIKKIDKNIKKIKLLLLRYVSRRIY